MRLLYGFLQALAQVNALLNLDNFAKLRKETFGFVTSVRPSIRLSVRTEHLCSHWMDYRVI